MAVPIGWVCTSCGKETRLGIKPTTSHLGKCSGNKAGVHKWIKSGK